MKRFDRTNLALFILITVFAVFALGALFWLHFRFESERLDSIEAIKQTFSTEVIGLPSDLETFRYDEVKRIADALVRNNAYLHGIFISKFIRTGSGIDERVILPWVFPVRRPDWRQALVPLDRHLLLLDNGLPYAAVYFDYDNTLLNSVRGAIAALGFMLIVVLILVGRRLRVQEVALTRTTVELQERKRELVELERLSLAGQLSANIFHDIRKPVLNIRMDVEAMESKDPADPDVRDRVGDIRRQIELFFNILREINIERFVRGDHGGREYVDLNDLLDRSCALVRYERRGVEVVKDYAESPMAIYAFPYRLILVFSNIILNAYQAMGGQGRLVLRTVQSDGWYEAHIADNGPGIAPDQLERIFEPFFTTHGGDGGGSGLGLYISHGIVQDMDGDIRVRSEPGEGTEFVVRLPVGDDDARKSSSARDTRLIGD